MKRHSIAIALAFGAVLSNLPMQAQTKAHRVLFAMTSSEETDWQLTLNNMRNLISGMAPETVEIEVVAYGPGIAFLKKDSVDAAEIQKLESSHVHFVACGNAMRKQHLEASDLIAGSEVVPAGIVEVMRKQEQGWSYIKAGR